MSEPKRLIVNIRGSNASGKTTLVRQIIAHSEGGLVGELGTFVGVKVSGHALTLPGLQLPVVIIGPYNASKYSGCDAIKSADAIEQAVRHEAELRKAHVIFEGFRVSKSYARFAALRNELTRSCDATWLWVFLHAPKELIWERAAARREDGKEIDKKELEAVVRQMDKTRTNCRQLWPQDCLTLDPKNSPDTVYLRLLCEMTAREQGKTHGPDPDMRPI